MYKILISDKLADDAIALLKNEKDVSYEVKTGLSEDELANEIKNYDAVIIRSGTKITAKIIKNADKLKIIGRAGVGVDNVDIPAASQKGIIVMNTPDANTLSTCEQTIALILSVVRNIPQAYLSLKNKKWERSKFVGIELYGKTVGIIGLGRIGTEVAKRLKSFGMKILGYDPFISKEKAEEIDIELKDFNSVIKESDIITVHVPKTKDTINLISKKEIDMMKDGVILINCARGGIINEKDAYEALKNGKVSKAAFDVFEKEPPFDSPLLELNNVVLTPHLGASTKEAQEKVGKGIVAQVIEALKGGMIKNAVNIPAIPPDLLKEIQPYLTLNEILGSFVSQIVEGNIKSVTVEYSGEVTKYDLKVLTIAAIKGILLPVIEGNVNYVNAELLAKERGIEVIEKTTTVKTLFPTLISVKIETEKEKRIVFGALSIKKEPRIVGVDDFEMEIIPSKYMIVYKNIDRPGVIGRMGTVLGANNINIASFTLGRSIKENVALGIVTVDNEVPKDVIDSIKNMEDILDAKYVTLN